MRLVHVTNLRASTALCGYYFIDHRKSSFLYKMWKVHRQAIVLIQACPPVAGHHHHILGDGQEHRSCLEGLDSSLIELEHVSFEHFTFRPKALSCLRWTWQYNLAYVHSSEGCTMTNLFTAHKGVADLDYKSRSRHRTCMCLTQAIVSLRASSHSHAQNLVGNRWWVQRFAQSSLKTRLGQK